MLRWCLNAQPHQSMALCWDLEGLDPAVTSVPCFVLAAERQMFLATWKDIPNENEAQFQIKDCSLNAGESKPFTRLLVRHVP